MWRTVSTLAFLLSCVGMVYSSSYFSTEPMRLGIKGSFVIAAICKDGIILASDSRANIFDKKNSEQTPIAYFDSIQKVFPIGSNAIAETGQGMILNVFFSAIIGDFMKHYNASEKVDRLLPALTDYVFRSYPQEAVVEIRKQKLFSAGYVERVPTVCYFNESQPEGAFGCIRGSGFIESDHTFLSDYENELPTLSASDAAALVKKAIQGYAQQGERWKTIGGPISILLITQSGLTWLENEPPPQRWVYVQDILRDYRGGTFEFHLIPPATREQLEELFATVRGN